MPLCTRGPFASAFFYVHLFLGGGDVRRRAVGDAVGARHHEREKPRRALARRLLLLARVHQTFGSHEP